MFHTFKMVLKQNGQIVFHYIAREIKKKTGVFSFFLTLLFSFFLPPSHLAYLLFETFKKAQKTTENNTINN